MRKDQYEWNQKHNLPKAGKEQTDLGLSKRHEALLTAALCAAGENSRHVDPQGPGGVSGQLRIGCKDAGKHRRKEQNRRPEQHRIGHADRKNQKERLFHTVSVTCTIVIADNRLSSLADALQRERHQLAHAGNDGHGPDCKVSSVSGKACRKGDRQKALCREHHECGNAKSKAGQNHRAFQLQAGRLQLQDGLFPGQEAQNPHGSHHLAEHGCKRSSANTKSKRKDKDRIQNNVDDRSDQCRHHADLRKPLRGNKGIHSHHNKHKNASENINSGIAERIGKRHLTCTEQLQKRRSRDIKDHGQCHRKNHQNREAVSQNLFCKIMLLPSHANCSKRCSACPCQHGKGIDQHQDRHEKPNSCKSCCTDLRHMSNVNPVYNVIQKIHELCDHRRNCQLRQKLRNTSIFHLLRFLLLIHLFSSYSISYRL